VDELKEILTEFAYSGWDLIAIPAGKWLDWGGDKTDLLAAIRRAFLLCGNCGCEFDPLYERAFVLLSKTNIKDRIRNEKQHMNKIRFIMNHVIVPIYIFITIVSMALGGILMETDEAKYTPVFIGIMIGYGLLSLALLVSVPFMRKKELRIELANVDYDTLSVEDKKEYEFLDSYQMKVMLSAPGVVIDDVLYKYERFNIGVATSNYLLRIAIYLHFSFRDEDEKYGFEFSIPVTKELLYAVRKFNIDMVNKEDFDFIVYNKEKAFHQIFKYGYVKKHDLRSETDDS